MKVGVLTFHRAVNFGAILQVYALQQTLLRMGVESEVVDYRSPAIEQRYERPSLGSLLRPKAIAVTLLRNTYTHDNRPNFRRFVEERLAVSDDVYDGPLSLRNAIGKYSMFVTGSDQVWNYQITGFDTSYFLDFAPPELRFSYSASFGLEEIPANFVPQYENLLRDFSGISVREISGKRLVRELADRDSVVGLDPTLLLDQADWFNIAEKVDVDGSFVLLYMLFEDHDLVRQAKSYARRHGLTVIYISDRLFRFPGITTLANLRPEQWIGLFRDAEKIFTNSFHGLAFAINFEKSFELRLLPGRSKVNSRLRDLLLLLDVDIERAIAGGPMDWDSVRGKLQECRASSIDYLRWATQRRGVSTTRVIGDE